MRIIKPQWVLHPGEKNEPSAVYSIDLHPDGSRFATGGGDSSVRLWSTSVLLTTPDTSDEPDTATAGDDQDSGEPAPPPGAALATLSNHTAVVTVVRWSTSGHMLASGSDDTYVLLWERRAHGSLGAQPFGSAPNLENWCRVAACRGHEMDVLDLAWAPDDAMLASCSIDNKVLVWRPPPRGGGVSSHGAVLSPVHVLSGHTNWVKGVAWDPTGRYLASASEDRRVIVWRVGGADNTSAGSRASSGMSTWEVEAEINTPFEGVSEQAFFQRLSWSPDGESLCVTHAQKSTRPVAAMLSRGSWSSDADLVGHKEPIVAARFCPTLFRPATPESGADNMSTPAGEPLQSIVAIGAKDAAISVWTCGADRPLVVLRECFTSAVSDLSWSRAASRRDSANADDGDDFLLIGSSHDGSICAFVFDASADGFGSQIPNEERVAALKQKYGSGAAATAHDNLANSEVFESATALQLAAEELRAREKERAATSASNGERASSARGGVAGRPVGPMAPQARQVESQCRRTGKKRISPVLVTVPSVAVDCRDQPGTLPPQSPVRKASVAGPGMGPAERKRQSDESNANTSSSTSASQAAQLASSSALPSQSHSPMAMAMAPGNGGSSGGNGAHKRSVKRARLEPSAAVSQTAPSPQATAATITTAGSAAAPPRPSANGGALPDVRLGSATAASAPVAACDRSQAPHPQNRRVARASASDSAQPEWLLPVPEVRPLATRTIRGGAATEESDSARPGGLAAPLVLEWCTVSSSPRTRTRVTLSRNGASLWDDTVDGAVCAADASTDGELCAAGCADGALFVFGVGGIRLLPPLMLGAPVTHVECSAIRTVSSTRAKPYDRYLLVVCADGALHLWETTTMRCVVVDSVQPALRSMALGACSGSAVPITAPCRASTPLLEKCAIVSSGTPLLLLSLATLPERSNDDGGGIMQAFMFHRELRTWLRLADTRYVQFAPCRNIELTQKIAQD